MRGARTALIILFCVSFCNYLDRFILSVLLPSIKADLGLTDTQLGALGTAFTVSYVLLSIPFARLADRYSRKTIISLCVAIWSAMTALCGFAQTFWQLAIARVLVGVGEAGATPPSHALIADFYPLTKRTTALAVFGLGAPFGIIIGFITASWIAQNYDWRAAFLALGLPGLVLALCVYFGIREPRRGASDAPEKAQQAVEYISFMGSVKALWQSSAFCHFAFATGLYTVVYIGVVNWLPSYFIRSFDMELSQVGLWLAMSLGLSQLIGSLSCGVLTDHLVKRSVLWFSRIPALAMLLSSPLFLIVFGTQSPVMSALALALAFLIGIFQGPASFAAVQGIVHVRIRATAVAIFLCITNLVGGMIGPLFTGWLSDYLEPTYGDEALRQALLFVVLIFGFWSALHYALAGRTLRQEMADTYSAP
jgi:MFS family permease